MSSPKVTIKVDINDENVEEFYRDFTNREALLIIGISPYSKEKVKKDSSEAVEKGLKEGSKKGSEAFSKNTKTMLGNLKSPLNALGKSFSDSLSGSFDSMQMGIIGLSGAISGMGIGMIASNMATSFIEANQELEKFRQNVEKSFDLSSMEQLNSVLLSLSLRGSNEESLKKMKELQASSSAFNDNIGLLNIAFENFDALVDSNQVKFSQLVNMVSKLEGKEILSAEDFLRLERLFESKGIEKNIIDSLKNIQNEGSLTVEGFANFIRDSIYNSSVTLTKESKGLFSTIGGFFSGYIVEPTKNFFTGTSKEVRNIKSDLDSLESGLGSLFEKSEKIKNQSSILSSNSLGDYTLMQQGQVINNVKSLINEIEDLIENSDIKFSFLGDKEKAKAIKEFKGVVELGNQFLTEKTESTAKLIVDKFQSTINLIKMPSLVDNEMKEAKDSSKTPMILEIDEMTERLKKLAFEYNVLQTTELASPFSETYLSDARVIVGLTQENLDLILKENDAKQKQLEIALDETKSYETRKKALDEWNEYVLARDKALAENRKAQELLPFDVEKTEQQLQEIHDRAQELLNVKGKISLDPASKSQIIADLKTLDDKIAEMEKYDLDLTEADKDLLERLKKEREDLQKVFDQSSDWGAKYGKTAAEYITMATEGIADILHGIANNGAKGGVYAGTKATLNFASSFDPTGASSAIVGGITSIFSGVDALWQKSIERKMDAIILEDTKFINEFNEVKDAEIKAYQDHVKELNEQFNKSKSVYDKMYSMGAIGGDAYNEAMGGLTNTVGAEIKDTNEKIQVAQLQKQMLDSYIARKQELQREQMEMRKWGVWDSSAYQDTTDRLGKIEGAISSIEGASSLAELEPFPRNAINYAYHGFDGYTNKPTLFMTSEYGQKEKVSITPSYRLSQGFDSMGHPAPLSNSYDSSFLRNSGSGGSTGGGISIGDINIVVNGAGDLNEEELSAKLTQKIIASIKKEFALGGYGGR